MNWLVILSEAKDLRSSRKRPLTPGPRRLMRTPSRPTLSPRERASQLGCYFEAPEEGADVSGLTFSMASRMPVSHFSVES